jgi:NAD(P)-dependent dehydrogenase (short-subunit alcohol dehydrogenase family)
MRSGDTAPVRKKRFAGGSRAAQTPTHTTKEEVSMPALENKVALITGASSGIGAAIALLFAAEGARVVLAARRSTELESVAAAITSCGGTAAVCAGDVADEGFAQALVATAVERFGSLDVAVNNAGTVGALGPVPDMALDNWRRVLAVNLDGAFLGAKFQIPALLSRPGAALLFVSSFVGHTVGMPGMSAYAASKAGLLGLVQVLAAEYGPRNLRVNALLPGGTDTPMGRDFANTPEALRFVRGLHALKRIAAPAEIARAALFLCSDAASFVTGTALLADGGVSINRV